MWGGSKAESTWRTYRRSLDQWFMTTDIPTQKHGILLFRALSGEAGLLIQHLSNEELCKENAGTRIRDILEYAYQHVTENEDQHDFDEAVYGLHRERHQTLLQFANVAQAAFIKADQHGDPLPQKRKGMIFLRRAKICLLYTSPSPRDGLLSRMPSSA